MSKNNIYVRVDDPQSVDKILRKFKRLCESFGVVREYKKRQAYCKPSMTLKEKRKASEKRRKKALMKQMHSGDKI